MERIENFIDGDFVSPASGEYIANIDPSRGVQYGEIPDSDGKDVAAAVEAAERAFPAWSSLKGPERFAHLMNLAKGIERRMDEFVAAESKDNGKPVSLARMVDIPRAIQNFEFYASAAIHFSSESNFTEGLGINYTLRRPLGVVACISPWNLPLYLFTWKIAPALAAGNTIVAKPSEITPMTAYMLAQVVKEVNFPKGVLNIIHGTGARTGDALTRHERVKAISFTGGTETGKRIIEVAGTQFKKLSLELGGKNPNLIFADCDFDKMLSTTVRSSFANQGQICLCGSRILVEESIYEKFKEAFVAKVSKMKVGDPSSEDTKLGAVVSEPHMEKILSYIDIAKQEGGRVLCGGERVRLGGDLENGYYIQPTVIEGLDQTCRTNQEEIFGPVVTLDTFKTEEEALEKANATNYGLASTVWTENLSRAHRVAEEMEAGIVWVNCWLQRDLRTPFGGVKNSGMGREGGFEAMQFFTEPKNVCISY
ncbi:MAG: aminomuconate-semialdehyde/2-hydroxymuconate-6-semialdehyde dehydrogenase [Flammeovirgaceae bacterium]|jgi:aminomuconate-semialdehyde/2-hydroxymuconate-6-semialdehyde dehydrogenase